MAKRKLRGHFTGGTDDIEYFFKHLQAFAEAEGWTQDWLERKPFGDHGPLHKLTFGYHLIDET